MREALGSVTVKTGRQMHLCIPLQNATPRIRKAFFKGCIQSSKIIINGEMDMKF